jgi:hypothetical protein
MRTLSNIAWNWPSPATAIHGLLLAPPLERPYKEMTPKLYGMKCNTRHTPRVMHNA